MVFPSQNPVCLFHKRHGADTQFVDKTEVAPVRPSKYLFCSVANSSAFPSSFINKELQKGRQSADISRSPYPDYYMY